MSHLFIDLVQNAKRWNPRQDELAGGSFGSPFQMDIRRILKDTSRLRRRRVASSLYISEALGGCKKVIVKVVVMHLRQESKSIAPLTVVGSGPRCSRL